MPSDLVLNTDDQDLWRKDSVDLIESILSDMLSFLGASSTLTLESVNSDDWFLLIYSHALDVPPPRRLTGGREAMTSACR